MSELPQRAHRWSLRVPVTFRVLDALTDGYTMNVSASGLLAEFPRPLDLWTEGTLEMEAGDHYLSIPARVARLEGLAVGMSFLLHDENHRRAVGILIAAAAGHAVPER